MFSQDNKGVFHVSFLCHGTVGEEGSGEEGRREEGGADGCGGRLGMTVKLLDPGKKFQRNRKNTNKCREGLSQLRV